MASCSTNQHDLVVFSCKIYEEEVALVKRLKPWVGDILASSKSVGTSLFLESFLILNAMKVDSLAPSISLISRSNASDSPHQLPSFDPDLYFSHLTSSSLGHMLLSTQKIPSTQGFVKEHVQEIGDGVVMVADSQTRGKGRGGNEWTSPDGCLMFTCARSISILGESAPFLNYVTCLGLIRGIRDVLGSIADVIRIKWPNDIVFHVADSSGSLSSSLKLGGILINSSYSSGKINVTTGIGLNVFNREPTICLEQLVEQNRSRDGEVKVALSREVLMARIISRLDECYDIFEASGFGPFEDDYIKSWMHSGQKVRTSDASFVGSKKGKEDEQLQREVTIIGVSRSGFLLAQDDYGSHYELSPDGNRLDMLNGLLYRRVP